VRTTTASPWLGRDPGGRRLSGGWLGFLGGDGVGRGVLDLPDLALVDIGLSGMIDGISVTAELAPLGVPVVVVTADCQRASAEGRELLADILIKPVQPITLVESVDSVLRKAKVD
jgi:DNA-binding response OmpR family regulator